MFLLFSGAFLFYFPSEIPIYDDDDNLCYFVRSLFLFFCLELFNLNPCTPFYCLPGGTGVVDGGIILIKSQKKLKQRHKSCVLPIFFFLKTGTYLKNNNIRQLFFIN